MNWKKTWLDTIFESYYICMMINATAIGEYDLHIKNNECEAYKHFSGDRKECFVLNLNGM